MKTDLAILGGGNGGYAAALRAVQLGLDVTLVEKGKVGGTCLHVGCIPTKALLHSADLVESFRKAGDFGVVAQPATVDWPKVLSRKDFVVSKHFKGLSALLKAKGIKVVEGKGRLSSPNTIEVDGSETIEARSVILASGSYARSLPFIEVDGEAFITSDHAVARLDAAVDHRRRCGCGRTGVCQRLRILRGGGYVGRGAAEAGSRRGR